MLNIDLEINNDTECEIVKYSLSEMIYLTQGDKIQKHLKKALKFYSTWEEWKRFKKEFKQCK